MLTSSIYRSTELGWSSTRSPAAAPPRCLPWPRTCPASTRWPGPRWRAGQPTHWAEGVPASDSVHRDPVTGVMVADINVEVLVTVRLVVRVDTKDPLMPHPASCLCEQGLLTAFRSLPLLLSSLCCISRFALITCYDTFLSENIWIERTRSEGLKLSQIKC